jgi:D-serine deaminase-like pyridoxal phosphate-dependent protein
MTPGDIAGYFALEPAPRRIGELETPVPLIDLDIAAANVMRWQARCEALGLANRPHIKTHKLAPLARFQLDAGAAGITVQKLGEAEAMAAAGIADMLLTFNIVGAPKLARLAALARRTGIAVVADSAAVMAGIGAAGEAAGRPIRVLIECDTGAGRNGVQTPADAVALARVADATAGVAFGGLMTYPKAGMRREAAAWLAEARALLAAAGLEAATVSSGGTPDMWRDEGLAPLTEYRAGTYIYNDRSLVAGGTAAPADCALHVLATVVSRPAPGRAIIDAGSKALTSDLLGLSGYGVTAEGAPVAALSEEHGILDVSGLARPPGVGEMVRILPNHVCPVSNLYDRVAVVRGGECLGLARVDARGAVS